jgi:hypothetical protein
MGRYRTSRSIIVDAIQCTEAKTIATDFGFINVKQGEWVICGEGGETYIVDDSFFQRTFVSIQENAQILEHVSRTERGPAPMTSSGSSFHRNRTRRAPRLVRRRRFPVSR